MRAFVLPAPGADPVVADVPDPAPGPGQVLVRVAASSLNGFDAAVAAGGLEGMMEHRYPVVLGKDFAGTVTALGEGADRFAVGQKVFGVVMKLFLGDGGIGQLLAVDQDGSIAAVPDGVGLDDAGALGLAGATALDGLAVVDPRPGATVLVSGAAGGVGVLAVQYAVAAGARVIATARPGAQADLVTELGAHHVVDRTGDVAAQVRALAPDGVDGVLHLAGDGPTLAGLLAPAARLASPLYFGPDQHPAAVVVMADPAESTLERLATDVAAGRLRVPRSATYDLEQAPQALAAYQGGSTGKTGITVG